MVSNTQGTLHGAVDQFWVVLGKPHSWLTSGGDHTQSARIPLESGEPKVGPRYTLQSQEGRLLPGPLTSYTSHDDTVEPWAGLWASLSLPHH